MSSKYVFLFQEGDGKNKKLLGGKGANLCEMTQIGLNVPPGFVISTEACLKYLESPDGELPSGLMDEVKQHMQAIEQATGKGFGNPENPLLVSVRSGSALSMPGMMDTILNLGLNRQTLQGLIKLTGDERFGYDAYRRFIQLFAKVAMSVGDEKFDDVFEVKKEEVGASEDLDLSAQDLKDVSDRFLSVYENETGKPFPDDVYDQLAASIKAVFGSWMGKRAVDYRREFNITSDMANGTAANVVTMVFGNMGPDSGTGVGFTRDPASGENLMFGEYLVNAQGEDVVAGIRTPKAIQEMAQEMPDLYTQLEELRNKLEKHYREIQDFEFTIEKGQLYCLQTRNGKMNATAMVRTSVEMVEEDLLTKEEALLRINPELLEQLLFPRLDPNSSVVPLAQGLPASPGAASGMCVFDADRAEELGKAGEKVILVREETKPEDIHGFFASQGILTSRGGKTSHAAVVARGMGKPCVAGAAGIDVDSRRRIARVGNMILQEGDIITIDGGLGYVYEGKVPTVDPEWTDHMDTLLKWADETAELKVRANADTPDDAKRSRQYGAVGIGLCRTERMFNTPERLPIVIDMIISETLEERQKYLDKLLEMQRSDFIGIFKEMSPYPVTIRLLDPPIHEFLPLEHVLREELDELAALRDAITGQLRLFNAIKTVNPDLHEEFATGKKPPVLRLKELDLAEVNATISKKELTLNRARVLAEMNPMLGHRGVRLSITNPEIYKMQIQAIIEAAAQCEKDGVKVHPELMVPQVAMEAELKWVEKLVEEVREKVESDYGVKVNFAYGTMIEVVRACVTAAQIASTAEFFSFGTNDLTQATFSFSREDAENKFLPNYVEEGLLAGNPFEALDTQGVGALMKIAVDGGRKTRPDIKIGICGEHGGHPASIHFCHHVGLDYVSCSGPRVPIARLAAAHANLEKRAFDF